jgi:hypothetical protein
MNVTNLMQHSHTVRETIESVGFTSIMPEKAATVGAARTRTDRQSVYRRLLAYYICDPCYNYS